jgi:hypothetical protein
MTDYQYSPEQALARDLLTLAVNGGINHWARVHGYSVDCPPDQVRAEGIDIADRSLWTVELTDIEQAVTKVIEQPAACGALDSGVDQAILSHAATALHASLIAHRHQLPMTDDAQLDRRIADIVIQVAIAGEVIYG